MAEELRTNHGIDTIENASESMSLLLICIWHESDEGLHRFDLLDQGRIRDSGIVDWVDL